MTQIGFSREEAHEALDQFLADLDRGEPIGRWIGDGTDGALAYIEPAKSWQEIRDGYGHWLDAQEVADEVNEPPGYAPWRHSPLATTDRLLPTEPLEGPLAWAVFRKKYEDLTEDEQARVHITAILCLLRVRLDPDGQGAVPVLMVGHEPDEPGEKLRWHVAYVTGVPGLFLRVTANGFLGDEWGIVTGSGYRLASGWYDRDRAERAVAALGRVLPNTDWMRLRPDAYTPAAKEAITAVIHRYHYYGEDEGKPEPEPVMDEIPFPADS